MNFAKTVSAFGIYLAASMSLLAFSVWAWGPGTVHAGEKTNVKIIGFSYTGQYVAYEIFWRADLAPRASSKIRIVDVARNDFVGKSITHYVKPDAEGDIDERNLDLDEIRAAARKKAALEIRRWEITPGYDPGTIIKPHSISKTRDGGFKMRFSLGKNRYLLRLVERNYEPRGKCIGTPKIFTLTLTRLLSKSNGKMKVLQRDKKLYKSRGCVFSYAFNSAFVNGPDVPAKLSPVGIVVFIDASTPGHGGPDVTQLVVTGMLDF